MSSITTRKPITPTRAERTEWKKYLRDSLYILSEDRPELYPKTRDSLITMLYKFLYWANEYNEGYFSERKDADEDRYCAWLVQKYEDEYGEYEK